MIAGIIDHETETARDLRKFSGIWQLLPVRALTMITAASMAGVPLTNGFISKEMFFTELLANPIRSSNDNCSDRGNFIRYFCCYLFGIRLVHGVFFDGPIGKQGPK